MLAKQLLSKDEIFLAKKFLYQVYCNEIKWEIEKGNPSNLRIIKSNEDYYLEDIYCESANWFGVFNNSELIASIRVIEPVNNKLELELYEDNIVRSLKKKYNKIFEINRLAIKSDFLNSVASAIIIREVAKWGTKNNPECLITTYNSEDLKFLTFRLGFKQISAKGFRYSENDSTESHIVYLEIPDINILERIIHICDQVINKGEL